MVDREEDLEVASQGVTDTAILDLPLPNGGASDLIRSLHVPVLVMTHTEEEEVHKKFLDAGANEILPKTMTYEQVIAAVRRLGDEP